MIVMASTKMALAVCCVSQPLVVYREHFPLSSSKRSLYFYNDSFICGCVSLDSILIVALCPSYLTRYFNKDHNFALTYKIRYGHGA